MSPAKRKTTKRGTGAGPARKARRKSAAGPRSAGAHRGEPRDWRSETLERVRTLIRQAVPEVVEERKWGGVPVWSRAGILCTGESYKAVVKLTFAKGASLEDPSGLFNSSLEGKTRRAIDVREGDRIDAKAFTALVRAAAAFNASKGTFTRSGPARRT